MHCLLSIPCLYNMWFSYSCTCIYERWISHKNEDLLRAATDSFFMLFWLGWIWHTISDAPFSVALIHTIQDLFLSAPEFNAVKLLTLWDCHQQIWQRSMRRQIDQANHGLHHRTASSDLMQTGLLCISPSSVKKLCEICSLDQDMRSL